VRQADPSGENQELEEIKLMGSEVIAVAMVLLAIAGYVMLASPLFADVFFSGRKTASGVFRYIDNHKWKAEIESGS
jgi:hypothetical protein